MDLSSFGILLGGLGIGSLLTSFLQARWERSREREQRLFQEKRDAYINCLTIGSLSQTMPHDEALWQRTAAYERIMLCGNPEVIKHMLIVQKLPPGSSRKPLEDMIAAMRKDLSF